MTPAARVQSAALILDEVASGAHADRALLAWGRRSRFAGSGDRAAVADLVYAALRCRRSWGARAGGEDGRALMLAAAAEAEALDAWFTGDLHAPAPPTAEEIARLTAPLPPLPDPVRLDYPDWLGDELDRGLGPIRCAVMAALRQRAPLDLRVNLLRTDPAAAQAALAAAGITAEPLAAEPAALRVTGGGRGLQHSAPYRDGWVEIQDLSSQRVARFAGAAPGMRVLDFCAGGGGKTLALAMHMAGQGTLIAHDGAPARMADLPPRAARAGVAVGVLAPDPAPLGCDLVLVDAPCSGSGAWRRNPDAKWRMTPQDLGDLAALQDRVLAAAARHVRPGGVLVYATCSLLPTENADRIAAFLAEHPTFGAAGSLTLTPLDGGDGFFAARLIRGGTT